MEEEAFQRENTAILCDGNENVAHNMECKFLDSDCKRLNNKGNPYMV